jgi:hypothetical protein
MAEIDGDGSIIVERLLSFDEAARRFTYAHVTAPDPVTDYVATMTVSETTRIASPGPAILRRQA